MKNSTLKIILIWSLVLLVSWAHCRRKSETIKQFHRTGESIAVDNLLQQYEKEHRKFYEEEIGNGDHLEWPALDKKDLSNYCTKYLQQSVPTIITTGVTGVKIIRTLHYEKENKSITSEIVVVQCSVVPKNSNLAYYMTRTPEMDCVYALKSTRNWSKFILIIIQKYCDFEDKPLINRSLKRKWVETVNRKHSSTGEPIANDECLLKYELEHQELLKKEGDEGKHVEWPYSMAHNNLDFYCHQYMGECMPHRNRNSVKGQWNIKKLHYQKLNTNEDVYVTTVTCQPSVRSTRQYHMTRAPEANCVYALIRNGGTSKDPFIIIYKHCNFENLNDQQSILHDDDDVLNKNVILKTEVKEELLDTLKTIPLFPKD